MDDEDDFIADLYGALREEGDDMPLDEFRDWLSSMFGIERTMQELRKALSDAYD